MAEVSISVGPFVYRLPCRAGDEARYLALGAQIDARAKQAIASMGNLSENRMLLLASFLLADELNDAMAAPAARADALDPEMAEALAVQIEKVAASLEKLAEQA